MYIIDMDSQTVRCKYCGVFIQLDSYDSHCIERNHRNIYMESVDERLKQYERIAGEGMRGYRDTYR